nr:MAG TPA: minor structural protein GP20 [Caudoviricetes sp.]
MVIQKTKSPKSSTTSYKQKLTDCVNTARPFWLKKSNKVNSEEQNKPKKSDLPKRLHAKKGDFETLEKQYQAKIQELNEQITKRDAERDENLVKSHAQKLSSQLSDNPANQEILQILIEKRLSAKDGQLSVLDDSGAVSIMTLDDLAKQIQNCGKYDSLIIGTKSCGTGSNGQSAKRAGDYSEQERLALANSNPALFNQLFLE